MSPGERFAKMDAGPIGNAMSYILNQETGIWRSRVRRFGIFVL